ncbi:MAG: hypothetical protein IPL31_02065 [Saprospiraceae bacterium]|nr:hypothetical protein [Saprospiraceae bacterium]
MKKKVNKHFDGPYAIITWFAISLFIIIFIILLLPLSANVSFTYQQIVTNIYPEIYGLLFDIILFGIIISIYDIAKERKRNIQSEKEQIDDFRGWNSNEASHRILGSIKRLQRQKIYDIDLSSCYFKDIMLTDLCFMNSKMAGLTLLNTEVYNTTFHNIRSNFFTCRDSRIHGCSFQYGKINFNLHTTYISSVLFKNINVSSSSLFIKDLSFTLFEEVDFSYSFFNFDKCHFVEFNNCIFDECIVFKEFFDIISERRNRNLGYQKIIEEYDLVQEVSKRTGSKSPVWILRNKTKGKTPQPVHKIEREDTISMTDPWIRTGRCQPNFDLNEENDGH